MEFEFEEEGYLTCPHCNKEILEGDYEDHIRAHEDEDAGKDFRRNILTGLQMEVLTEEELLKKKYGYVIPKSLENLSKDDLKGLEKEIIIRAAMARYHRIAQGEEKFDPKKWVVPPKAKFDPKDYKLGENLFRIRVYTDEYSQKIEKELGEEAPTLETATKAIRGEYDEPIPKSKENLAKEFFEDLTERLFKLVEPLWSRQAKIKYPNLDLALQEAALLNMGKEIFRYMRCPVEDCTFSVPKKLSKKEKYIALVKHYLEDHLSKVKGTTKLSVMKRYLTNPAEDAMAKARKEFTHPREKGDDESVPGKLMPYQTGSPNPEQCSKGIESLSDLEKQLPKDAMPPVSERRGMFDDLRKKKDTSKDLARIYSDIAPDPERLEEMKEVYKPYYYDEKKFIRCKVCKAKLDSFRRFLIHMRTEHSKQYKRPSKYQDYYKVK